MELHQLLAEREIYRRLVAVARAMDDRNWGAFDDLTIETMTSDLGLGHQEGREAFLHTMRSYLDDCGPTQHLLGNVLIDIDGETASSKAYVSDMHLGTGEKSQMSFRTLGDYHDQWRCVDGRWLLTHRTKINSAHIGSFDVLGPGPQSDD
ncbi:MAG: nuclear transport factor 2 family protein [Halioglobus sp.]